MNTTKLRMQRGNRKKRRLLMADGKGRDHRHPYQRTCKNNPPHQEEDTGSLNSSAGNPYMIKHIYY